LKKPLPIWIFLSLQWKKRRLYAIYLKNQKVNQAKLAAKNPPVVKSADLPSKPECCKICELKKRGYKILFEQTNGNSDLFKVIFVVYLAEKEEK